MFTHPVTSRVQSNFDTPSFFLKFRLKKQTHVSENFFGGYLFVFVENLCNGSSKMRAKNFKNYISILAIVKCRNWLGASPVQA